MKNSVLIIVLVVACVATAAYSDGTSTNNWHPDTKALDLISSRGPDQFIGDAGITLARDVKRFYEALRDKEWHETYLLRAKAFREDIPESDYLAQAKKEGKFWGLADYEVLSVGFSNCIGSTNTDQATLICKFVELPDNAVCYSTVFWHKEEGTWKCLSAGPIKLFIFHGTRSPYIDWK